MDFVEKMNEKFNTVSYTFSITKFAEKFSLVIKLPLGAVLADKAKLSGTNLRPFEPSFGREGSDGRLIFVTWELVNPKLGEAVSARIIYEPLVGVIDSSLSEIALIGLIAIAILMVFGIFWRLRLRTENILPILNAAERAVVEILMKNKTIDQRDIVRATDFSKAKVSRVLKELESRGIVEVTPKGRTKKIKLSLGKSKPKEEKPEISKEEKELRESLQG
ncbi:MAG: winged helix-turn-helix transcriptional regulator [Candidatus Aenigmarchaeota archaeon]|nr:winged helix-turn-helix transcriptional regulator [Candidatus Aenigmarchaeota archaeon]